MTDDRQLLDELCQLAWDQPVSAPPGYDLDGVTDDELDRQPCSLRTASGYVPRPWVPPKRTAEYGLTLEDEARLPGQYPGSFRHGDGPCQADNAPWAADSSRLPEADDQLLEALAFVVQASGPFSFGILTNTLSVTEQLDFGYKLMAAAGRIRTRVETTSVDHGLQAPDGDAP